MPERLLKIREAAELLGMSENFLYKLVEGQQMPHVRVGRSVRFDPQELSAWIDERRRPACTGCPQRGR